MKRPKCKECKTEMKFTVYTLSNYCVNQDCKMYLYSVKDTRKGVKRKRKSKSKTVFTPPKAKTFKKSNPHLYDKELIKTLKQQLVTKYGLTCMKCGTNEKIVVEHIKSRYKGGSNELSNLQLLCYKCNFAKGHKEIDFRPF